MPALPGLRANPRRSSMGCTGETHTAARSRCGRARDGSRNYWRSEVPRHNWQHYLTAGEAGARLNGSLQPSPNECE